MAQDYDNEDRLYKEKMRRELSNAAGYANYATGGIVKTDNMTKIGDGDKGFVVPASLTFCGELPKRERIVPLLDDSFKLSAYDPNSIKGRIVDYFNNQTEKGLQKYGHTLDDCPDDKFDWRLMIIEELVDCIQYQQKEIVRLERLLNP